MESREGRIPAGGGASRLAPADAIGTCAKRSLVSDTSRCLSSIPLFVSFVHKNNMVFIINP